MEDRLTEKNIRYCEEENAKMHQEQLAHIFEFYDHLGKVENKLRELEDFIEQIDNTTIIHKDGIATLHIDMVLDSNTLETVKKYFNYKELER